MIFGLVCEGPRDYDLLSAVIKKRLPGSMVRLIQPEPSLTGESGNGWKGVWKWCRDHGGVTNPALKLEEILHGVDPPIDFLIVQMDGDVSRTERASHCSCVHAPCEFQTEVNLPECGHCGGQYNACPVRLPCPEHDENVEGYVSHLTGQLEAFFEEKSPVVFVIPCDSTDAWIVASFEDGETACEQIYNPWVNVISKNKKYHGIRVRSKKNRSTYQELITEMLKKWEQVTQKCSQAAKFDDALFSSAARAGNSRPQV